MIPLVLFGIDGHDGSALRRINLTRTAAKRSFDVYASQSHDFQIHDYEDFGKWERARERETSCSCVEPSLLKRFKRPLLRGDEEEENALALVLPDKTESNMPKRRSGVDEGCRGRQVFQPLANYSRRRGRYGAEKEGTWSIGMVA